MFSRLFVLVLLVLGLASGRVAAQKSGLASRERAAEILKYVNEHRVGKGMKPLIMNDTISFYSEQHSRNMASQKIAVGHDGFDARMAKVTKKVSPATGWAENVASSGGDARSVVEMWLNSPGHKRNIESDYNQTGVGIAKGQGGMTYYTQIFVKVGK